MKPVNIIVEKPSDDTKWEAVKAFLKALKINFVEEESYDPDFVKKIMGSKRQVAEGKLKKIQTEDLWK